MAGSGSALPSQARATREVAWVNGCGHASLPVDTSCPHPHPIATQQEVGLLTKTCTLCALEGSKLTHIPPPFSL